MWKERNESRPKIAGVLQHSRIEWPPRFDKDPKVSM